MSDYEAAKARLLGSRRRSADIRPISLPGIYVLFLSEPNFLPGIAATVSDTLYIGMTGSSLAIRNHFDRSDSGFSTLRRSLGALLKIELDLKAIPRGRGPSPTNTTNYRFEEAGELRLTKWMCCHLTYNEITIRGDVVSLETQLIEDLKPPLNLTGWRNPQREVIKALRTVCRDEARVIAKPGLQPT